MSIVDKLAKKTIKSNCRWDKTEFGKFLQTYNNAILFMEEAILPIRYNDFSSKIELFGEDYNPDINSIQIKEMMRDKKMAMSISTIQEAVMTIALRNRYHPVREYIQSLVWDGVPRVESWLISMCGAPNDKYSEIVSGISLVSAVRRVFEPGYQHDTMVIFEGDQGIGKSQLVRILGGKWYKSISLTDRDTNTVQLMQGAWFIEVAELSVFAKRDIESLKAFISNPVDYARFAFGRGDRAYPRQSVFIGTINPESNGYLNDSTGNRRFLPIKLNNINTAMVKSNRDQLLAEAYQLHLNKYKTYISDQETQDLVRSQQKEREFHDDWSTEIINYLRSRKLDSTTHYTAMDIYKLVFNGEKTHYDQRVSRRIANIMRAIGCGESKASTLNGVKGKYFDVSFILKNEAHIENVDYTTE